MNEIKMLKNELTRTTDFYESACERGSLRRVFLQSSAFFRYSV